MGDEDDSVREQVRATFVLGLTGALVALRIYASQSKTPLTVQFSERVYNVTFIVDFIILSFGLYALLMILGYSDFLENDVRKTFRFFGSFSLMASLSLIGIICLLIYGIIFPPYGLYFGLIIFCALIFLLFRNSNFREIPSVSEFKKNLSLKFFIFSTTSFIFYSITYFIMPIFYGSEVLEMGYAIIICVLGCFSILVRLLYRILQNRKEENVEKNE